jgi:hypothetical protein
MVFTFWTPLVCYESGRLAELAHDRVQWRVLGSDGVDHSGSATALKN